MDTITLNAGNLRHLLPGRRSDSHKGDYGHLLVVAGCRTMPGAAVLATGAALKSGCGLVTLHAPDRALLAVACNFPSAMLSEEPGPCFSTLPDRIGRYTAIAAGPGLGLDPATREALGTLLRAAAQAGIPMVLDADALTMLASDPALLESVPRGSVLTPHPGELRRFGAWDSEEGKYGVARDLARKSGAVVVAKGYGTRIFTPDGRTFVNSTGNPGLAKGGSGDVLTGLVGGLLARGLKAEDAAALGVWIHGRAGDFLTATCTAEAYNSRDLIESLWEGFIALERSQEPNG